MRVLISTWPASGHLQPIVPLSWALRGAGHEVVVATPQHLVPFVKSTGLDAIALGEEQDQKMMLQGIIQQAGENASPAEALPRPDRQFWGNIAYGPAGRTAEVLPLLLEKAKAFAPDLIVSDPMDLSGRLLGGILGVPVVRHRWGVDPLTEAFEETAHMVLDPVAQQMGLTGLPEPELTIDPCPPSFQLPGLEQGRPVRYLPSNGFGAVPAWALEEPSKPRICVSFGSMPKELGMRKVLGWVYEAIARLGDVEVVLAVPNGIDAEDHSVIADKVISSSHLPLNLFMRTCSVIVHHGGSGTGLTALNAATPQLVLPQFADHFPWAERLEATGAGAFVEGTEKQQDVSFIQDRLEELIHKPEAKEASLALQAEIHGAPSPAALVPELEALAGV
ncbi:nucleotide disphospho-sugar-binding domain-containing protein [Lentzea sp. HUAS12]|uniref:nucleotide disphospho-sugar-binding domain-containing protein n=1 Tax=Lentzea sp. HUAS12 TaxID=2951806 RepID=UPI00209D877D|nr:nucleotide disphospho-sugar-binding domain-containing protein [Lentzea sp. HUAS12]USX48334.1 DUF1205 domain-containing protein [Lentzea sp. HUAS12]